MSEIQSLAPAPKRGTSDWYVLVVLSTVYGLNLVDRSLIQILLQPIKVDLKLSDTELGFLTGIAFGVFYATLGLPIARWADRGDRAKIAAGAIGLWGLTVMGSMFVTGFATMVLARVAAAVGEAGCKPPTYSLVGDYFPGSRERTRAMAVYWIGGPIASLVGYVAGGWLNELYGWRVTFMIMGVPGLLLAAVVFLTIRDPRKAASQSHAVPTASIPFRTVAQVLWRVPTLRHLTIALTLLYTMNFGLNPWYAAFLMRSHGMGSGELGTILGLIFGLSGIFGILLGGVVCERFLDGDERAQSRATALAVTATVPAFAAFLLLESRIAALASLAIVMIVINFFFAPVYTLLQRLVPDTMRATALAAILLLTNFIGMGIGPQLVGTLSDLLAPRYGADSLRYAMLASAFIAPWAAYHFWRAGATVSMDLARGEVAGK